MLAFRPHAVIEVGSKIGMYEVVARLRSGGMASLFLARRVGAAGFARHVAIKVIHPHLAEDRTFVQMFIDEALLCSRIEHPNVVHVEELGEIDGAHFLVMEYVHGVALNQLLEALARQSRALSPELAVHVAMQVADGLQAAHESEGEDGRPLGIIHRDVSPQNVLLSFKGHVKLIDFGIAKARGRAQQTVGGNLKGKVRYMAPEQARGRSIDSRVDIYALGVVLWETLAMRRLFQAENEFRLLQMVQDPEIDPPSLHNEQVPPELDRAVLAALSPDPAERPATAGDLRRLLAEALPKARDVHSSDLATVINAVMKDALQETRQILPESVSRELGGMTKPVARERREEVLRTMTIRLDSSDILDEADLPRPPDRARASAPPPIPADALRPRGLPVPVPPQSTPATATSISSGRRTLPAPVIAAIAAALIIPAAAIGIWLGSDGDDETERPRSGAIELPTTPAVATPIPVGTGPAPALPLPTPTPQYGTTPLPGSPLAPPIPAQLSRDAGPGADPGGRNRLTRRERDRERDRERTGSTPSGTTGGHQRGVRIVDGVPLLQ